MNGCAEITPAIQGREDNEMGMAMRLARWLLGFPERRPNPYVPKVTVEFTETWTDEPPIEITEGVTIMIEYRDGAGTWSRRPVTITGLNIEIDTTYLETWCHMREDERTFRVDRIESIVDEAGEVHEDAPRYLEERLGLPPGTIILPRSRARHGRSREDAWALLRRNVRPQAILFAALARASGVMRPEEVAFALAHCVEIAEARGLLFGDDEIEKLEAYIRRERPDAVRIETAIEGMLVCTPAEIHGFLDAALDLIRADGRRAPQEVALLNRIARDLTGKPVA